VYSASFEPSENRFNSFYIKAALLVVARHSCVYLFSFLIYKHLIKWNVLLYIAGLILLLMVLIIGHVGMGAQRWINIGGFKFQPSEFFKIIFILMMPKIYNDFDQRLLGFFDVFKKFILVIPPFILVFYSLI